MCIEKMNKFLILSIKMAGNLLILCSGLSTWSVQAKSLNHGLMQRNSPFQSMVDNHLTLHGRDTTTLNPKTRQIQLVDELFRVHYAKAGDIAILIKDENHSLMSQHGLLSIDARTNSLWIRDKPSRITMIHHFIQQIDIPVRQELIEARIVNVTQEGITDLGIRFGRNKPIQVEDPATTSEMSTPGVGGIIGSFAQRLNVDFAVPGVQAATMGIALAQLAEGILLDLELSALESEDKVEMISNPRLIATNQQSATIESGEEIPYQEATRSGATAVAFKKAVLSLKVTPQITPDNHLLMALEINQDSPSGHMVNGVPAISMKAIHTHVLVKDGQTIVLGGIYKRDQNNRINRVPFLGKLPIIGDLFKNQHHQVKNEELLIFITPRIIASNA